MNERTVIEKGERNQTLSWRWTIRDGKKEVHFTCKCHASGPLTDHIIGPDGDVAPSVHHDTKECGFHSYITLKGYDPDGT
jgi:hypothetical protein